MIGQMLNNEDLKMKFRFAIIAALMFSTTGLGAAEAVQRHISVSGRGVVQVAPDMADITLGVQHQAKTAREAMRATSDALSAVIEGVQSFGVAENDIQTTGLSLNPVYERRDNSNQAPRLVGFSASNMITIKVRDLDRLGALLDRVITVGATNFRGLNFGLADRSAALDTARRKAVADALARAQLYAQAAGVELGEVLSISESGSQPVFSRRMEVQTLAMDSVPIAPGELTISASIGLSIGLK
jgi:uncharacterized protein YggE